MKVFWFSAIFYDNTDHYGSKTNPILPTKGLVLDIYYSFFIWTKFIKLSLKVISLETKKKLFDELL